MGAADGKKSDTLGAEEVLMGTLGAKRSPFIVGRALPDQQLRDFLVFINCQM
jgi:hypothetical protein